MRFFAIFIVVFSLSVISEGCAFAKRASVAGSTPAKYEWKQVALKAPYPESYNYPVFVFGNWMVAMNKDRISAELRIGCLERNLFPFILCRS